MLPETALAYCGCGQAPTPHQRRSDEPLGPLYWVACPCGLRTPDKPTAKAAAQRWNQGVRMTQEQLQAAQERARGASDDDGRRWRGLPYKRAL